MLYCRGDRVKKQFSKRKSVLCSTVKHLARVLIGHCRKRITQVMKCSLLEENGMLIKNMALLIVKVEKIKNNKNNKNNKSSSEGRSGFFKVTFSPKCKHQHGKCI